MGRAGWTVVVVVAVVAVGWFGYRWYRGHTKVAPQYETTTIDRGRIVAKVTASGTLSALVTVQVGSQVSGRLLEIRVDYNSPVKKGEVLARLDPELFQATVSQSKASVSIADGNLAKAKVQALDARRQADRSKTLFDKHIVTQADVDTAETTAEAAEASVTVAQGSLDQARASLEQADANLSYTTIVSPNDGIVISRAVDVGQTVAASLQAPTLFTIAEDLRKMQVDTSVAEADVGKVREGMPASFTVDAYPGETFRGTVRQVRNAPQTVQNVVTYDAVIDVANDDLRLKPGMTANATFIYAQADDALRVPNVALRFRPPQEVLAIAKPLPPKPAAEAKKPDGGKTDAGSGTPDAGSAKPEADGQKPAADGQRPAADGQKLVVAGQKPEAGERKHGNWQGRGGGAGGWKKHGDEQKSVWVLRDGVPTQVAVTAGISDGSLTEIKGEVTEGEGVITDVITDAAAPSSSSGPGMPGMPRMGGGRRGF